MTKIINWQTEEVIIEDPNLSLRELAEKAVKEGISLAYADLRYADLSYAELYGADFTGADLSYADCRHTYLCGVDLSKTNVTGAELEKAIFY